jgi:hypothetical protein
MLDETVDASRHGESRKVQDLRDDVGDALATLTVLVNPG